MDALAERIRAVGLNFEPRALRLLAKLEQVGDVCIGWPDSNLLQNRLVWLPSGRSDARTTAIVSSRLGRGLDELDFVFRAIRVAVTQLDPHRQVLLSAEGTTTHRFVVRAAQLFGVPIIRIRTARPKQTLDSWLRETS